MEEKPRQKTFLVTGAMGCIGAWVLRHLVKRGERAVGFDLSDDRHRLALLLTPEEQHRITFVRGDLVDFEQVHRTLADYSITHIIHLGALQVPFCRANPVAGARVNVVGTTNVFEAAQQCTLKHVVYASSIAVYGPPSDYPPGPLKADAPMAPRTHYGAYKQANERTALAYWYESGLNSTALRPHTVYGLGRDQGVTSDPSKAMLAAAAGKPFRINFSNRLQLQLASDVALQFLEASLHPLEGAQAFNLGGECPSMTELAELIRNIVPESEISHGDLQLPFPANLDDSELRQSFANVHQTPLEAGVRTTIEEFRRCLKAGLIGEA